MNYLRHIFDYLLCNFNLLREVFYHMKKIFFFARDRFFIKPFTAGLLPEPVCLARNGAADLPHNLAVQGGRRRREHAHLRKLPYADVAAVENDYLVLLGSAV